ncbi:hypothetical protein DFH08DRAFT_934213 [Mycena albidolilacea]|uniref:Uncharacterized protein n=1 Tax=Mycena albidolilacea TaxID=1033008 RepID=A0AAD7EUR1_9AGAR|nr:hypothetical protein DFH08DRAFT_934213 [Mycena albidolilacea]
MHGLLIRCFCARLALFALLAGTASMEHNLIALWPHYSLKPNVSVGYIISTTEKIEEVQLSSTMPLTSDLHKSAYTRPGQTPFSQKFLDLRGFSEKKSHNGVFPKCLFAGFSSSDPESVIRHRGLCAVEDQEIQYSERHIPILTL